MSVYLQHTGERKESRQALIDMLKSGDARGIILSPRDEKPKELVDLLVSARGAREDIDILFDPQFYASVIRPVNERNLGAYKYFRQNLKISDFAKVDNIKKFVKDCIDYQRNLANNTLRYTVSRYVSPSVLIDDLNGRWEQASISLAYESANYAAEKDIPILITLIIEEHALKHRAYLDDFLNTITGLNSIQGFYLLIKRPMVTYHSPFDATALANLMYLIYVLTEVNGYETICGYTDLTGMLLHAVGANSIGTGSLISSRRFTYSRWTPKKSGGGSAPPDRYTSIPLLAPVYVNPVMTGAIDKELVERILSGGDYDKLIIDQLTRGGILWSGDVEFKQHIFSVKELLGRVRGRTTKARLASVSRLIQDAEYLRRLLDEHDVQLGELPKLEVWQNAIELFEEEAEV
ncbi:MAG: hypothetical protein IT327_23870 [Anaerolineae bacterium]|nr:hypothetical protein [Anaerolineae bacterium]